MKHLILFMLPFITGALIVVFLFKDGFHLHPILRWGDSHKDINDNTRLFERCLWLKVSDDGSNASYRKLFCLPEEI
jgi:hypothetical protein